MDLGKMRAKVGSKGGRAKNPNKGFGSLSKEERSRLSSEAAKKRWAKREQKDQMG